MKYSTKATVISNPYTRPVRAFDTDCVVQYTIVCRKDKKREIPFVKYTCKYRKSKLTHEPREYLFLRLAARSLSNAPWTSISMESSVFCLIPAKSPVTLEWLQQQKPWNSGADLSGPVAFKNSISRRP